MPGPLPSDKPGRQVRPARDLAWTDLPIDGRPGDPPAPPPLRVAGLAWWDWNWRTPSASQWTDAEHDIARRRAELEDLWQETSETKVLAEMRHCESALGLTPKARKELRWRIVADTGEVVEQAGLTDELDGKRRTRKIRDAQAG